MFIRVMTPPDNIDPAFALILSAVLFFLCAVVYTWTPLKQKVDNWAAGRRHARRERNRKRAQAQAFVELREYAKKDVRMTMQAVNPQRRPVYQKPRHRVEV